MPQHINMYVMAFLLYLTSVSSWLRSKWRLTASILVVTYTYSLALGFVLPSGIVALLAVMLMAFLCGQTPDCLRGMLLHGVFLVLAIMLAAHVVPGFHNPLLLGPVTFTPDAYPFRMYLNIDKSSVGLAILLFYRPLDRGTSVARSLIVGSGGAGLAIILLLPPAVQWHAVQWAPKLPEGISVWALNNFLSVAFTEEALFRGVLQASLARWLRTHAWGTGMAIGIAALAFGFAHYAAGPLMMLFASLAGLAYGLAYSRGGLLASIWAHFGFNLFHILLFTYPLLMHP